MSRSHFHSSKDADYLNYLKSGTKKNEPQSLLMWSKLQMEGLYGVKKSQGKAFSTFKQVKQTTNRGTIEYRVACFNLMLCYLLGLGVEKDLSKIKNLSKETQFNINAEVTTHPCALTIPSTAEQILEFETAIKGPVQGAKGMRLWAKMVGRNKDPDSQQIEKAMVKVQKNQSCANCGISDTDRIEKLATQTGVSSTPEQRLKDIEKIFKKCGGCLKVVYCDAVCQKNHWKIHKLECRPAAQSSSASDNKSKRPTPEVTSDDID
jgi:hypothetical protein